MREAYTRVMGNAWGDHDTGWKFRKAPVEAKLLQSAVKGIWRALVGKPCKLPIVVTHRGGFRRQWNHSKQRWELLINPKQGWYYTVHDLGHFLHGRLHPSDKPHTDRHLEMERIAAAYVVRRYLDPK
jgi:hypothetical protein